MLFVVWCAYVKLGGAAETSLGAVFVIVNVKEIVVADDSGCGSLAVSVI
jgi:hypothetical protein